MIPWTMKRLKAARAACAAMLAGPKGEGDWPEDVKAEDLESAKARLNEEIDLRNLKAARK